MTDAEKAEKEKADKEAAEKAAAEKAAPAEPVRSAPALPADALAAISRRVSKVEAAGARVAWTVAGFAAFVGACIAAAILFAPQIGARIRQWRGASK